MTLIGDGSWPDKENNEENLSGKETLHSCEIKVRSLWSFGGKGRTLLHVILIDVPTEIDYVLYRNNDRIVCMFSAFGVQVM